MSACRAGICKLPVTSGIFLYNSFQNKNPKVVQYLYKDVPKNDMLF